ncbi:MAG: LapA family protein [Pseudomonadota bacterium]
MNGFFKWILSVLVMAGLVSFALLNRGDVTLNWFPAYTQLSMSLSLFVLIVFAKGFIIGALMVWLDFGAKRRELRALRKYKKQQEKLADDTLPADPYGVAFPSAATQPSPLPPIVPPVDRE